MTYRAEEVGQRDGSPLANSNCRMAAGATGIDYQTGGAVTSSGADMRSRQADQAGGTDALDLAQAWQTYGQPLSIVRSGSWSAAEADLRAGRLIMLDVWHAACGGPCLSGSGAYGHTIAVAPEAAGSKWLTGDPWCLPARWTWWEGAKLKAGAEEWGRRIRLATGGRELTETQLAPIIRNLFRRWTPEFPALGRDAETGGGAGSPIAYTRSQVPKESAMSRFVVSAGYAVGSSRLLDVAKGAPWTYLDGSPGGTFAAATTVTAVGRVDGHSNEYAVEIKTGVPYADKVGRDTIIAVRSVTDSYPAPAPPPPATPDGDADAVRAARDEEWREWLLAGSPGEPTA